MNQASSGTSHLGGAPSAGADLTYRARVARTATQIQSALATQPGEQARAQLALSAVYHCDTQFAGEVLLGCPREATDTPWLDLARTVGTYLQVRRTDYLADELIAELGVGQSRSGSGPELAELVEEASWHRTRFSGRSRRQGNEE